MLPTASRPGLERAVARSERFDCKPCFAPSEMSAASRAPLPSPRPPPWCASWGTGSAAGAACGRTWAVVQASGKPSQSSEGIESVYGRASRLARCLRALASPACTCVVSPLLCPLDSAAPPCGSACTSNASAGYITPSLAHSLCALASVLLAALLLPPVLEFVGAALAARAASGVSATSLPPEATAEPDTSRPECLVRGAGEAGRCGSPSEASCRARASSLRFCSTCANAAAWSSNKPPAPAYTIQVQRMASDFLEPLPHGTGAQHGAPILRERGRRGIVAAVCTMPRAQCTLASACALVRASLGECQLGTRVKISTYFLV